ncbi:MAG: double zinc ribbon domain-containing protein, partial [Planctomycetota bacterium]
MRCPACRHDNPAALAFCGHCGARLDFTADEIEHALAEKART